MLLCVAALVLAANLVGIFVLARRLAGAFTEPLSAASYSLLLIVSTGFVILAEALFANSPVARRSRELDLLAGIAGFSVPILWGLALIPVSAWGGWMLLAGCCLVVGAVAFAADWIWPPLGRFAAAVRQAVIPSPLGESTVAGRPIDEPEFADEAADSPAAVWMKRTRAADGTEQLEGVVLADFAPGQKQAAAHVAFCPPFEQIPAFDCELLEGADVRAKVGAVYVYGARLDLKRAGETDAALAVSVHYAATATRTSGG
jgi:hypothetical protein